MPPLRVTVPDTRAQATARLTDEERARLLSAAQEMLGRAYAPYSKFRVGAAILTNAGNVFTGCNVENASYGLTNCAERTAIFSAVAAEGEAMRVRAVVVLNAQNVPCSPCGGCRQVMFEFGPDAVVLFQGTKGIEESTTRALLPAGFTL